MSRKSLLVLLTLGLALALIAGCSGGSAPSPTSAPAAAATTAPAPAATTVPTSAPTAVPKAAPTQAPSPIATPTTAASAGGSDVLDKMKTIHAFSADFTAESGGQQTKGKMVFSGNKMRMDIEDMGVTTALMADENKKTAYMYNSKDKQALSMPYDQSVTGQTPGEMLDWEKHMAAPPKLLGEETVDGKACVVYEFTTAKATSKTWIDKATGFPIKSESTEGGQRVSMHFTNIVIGNVDESRLTLPPDTEIHDVSELTGGLATPTAGRATPGSVSVSPTPVRTSSTPVRTSSIVLSLAAIVGPVPEVLKKNVPIPSGFSLVDKLTGGQYVEDLDTGTFEATAKWSGNASVKQIADFYASVLAQGWESRGGVVGDATVDVTYDQKNTDPVVKLRVQAEPGSGGTILTLTITGETRR